MAHGLFTLATSFLRNPIFTGIVGIAGLVFGVYAYFDTKSEPQLIARIQPIRGTIVSSDALSKLQIFYEGKLIDGAVTTIQVALWNNGNKAIRNDDVLEEVQLYFDPPVHVISAEVKQKTRDIIGLQVDKSRLNEGIVPVTWTILENKDGAILQLTYVGNPDADIKIRGAVVGQQEVEFYSRRNAQRKDKTFSSYPSKWQKPTLIAVFSAVGIIMASLLMEALLQSIRKRSKSGTSSKFVQLLAAKLPRGSEIAQFIFVVGIVSFFTSLALVILVGSAPPPPFVF